MGTEQPDGRTAVKFGVLFEETANVIAGLSATLITARKRGSIDYEGELLMQGKDNNVLVYLQPEAEQNRASHLATEQLKTNVKKAETVDVSKSLKKHEDEVYMENPTASGSGKLVCSECGETVLMTEKVTINAKTFHKKCFVCEICKSPLTVTQFANLDGHVYCVPHYKQRFNVHCNYNIHKEK